MIRLFLVIAFVAVSAAVSHANSIAVADGDSFRMGGERYRLQNIDAPELDQMCRDGAGREWTCGRRARDELRRLLNQGPVDCRTITRDRFRRIVATCSVGGRDVGEVMVRNGWATAYKGRGATSRYLSAESEARAGRRGLWAGTFEAPRQWRQGHPRDEPDNQVLSREAQDWLRRKTQAVSDWWRSLWNPPVRER